MVLHRRLKNSKLTRSQIIWYGVVNQLFAARVKSAHFVILQPPKFLSSLQDSCCSAVMFECRLTQGSLLKKIMEAISPLVTEVNIECSSSGRPYIISVKKVLYLIVAK